ncbi:MAG: flagellar hook-associated 2 domain protein [Acidimicrobiia bacterium]|nr:flagellar hook-associated 2 domain protein [Acidimicrobiia bacterium]
MSVSNVNGSSPLINFSGLSSGLDTNAIITAMMAVEKRPQVLLQNRQTAYQAMDSAFGSVITKLNALQTAARNIGNPIDWTPVTASSSDTTRATVTSSNASTTGSVSFTVQSLASLDTIVSSGQAADTNVTSVAPGTITIGTSAGSTTVNTGGGTLDEVALAINSQSVVGLKAAVVQSAPGQFKLQLTATNVAETVNTPMAQFSGLGGSWTQVSTASQAMIHVGSAGLGYNVYSNTNQFTNLLPGVNVTVKQADPITMVTVQSGPDASAMTTKVQKMVDAYNGAVDEIKKQTAYDPTTKVAAPLQGQSALRSVTSALAQAVSGSITGTTPALVGIQLDSTGHMAFDQNAFSAAYLANPASVQQTFADPLNTTNPGLVDRLKTEITNAVAPGTGSLRTSQTGVETTITGLSTSIAQYQVRLDQRQTFLRKQFAALESVMSGLQSQGNTLQSRLGSSN